MSSPDDGPLRPSEDDTAALTAAAEAAWHEEGWAAHELPEVIHAEGRLRGLRVRPDIAARIAREVALRPPRRAG